MNHLHNSTLEALEQLESRGYNDGKVVIYCHPHTLRSNIDKKPRKPFASEVDYFGKPVETSANVPEDIVMVVHLEAAFHGPDSIAFATIGGEADE